MHGVAMKTAEEVRAMLTAIKLAYETILYVVQDLIYHGILGPRWYPFKDIISCLFQPYSMLI